MRLTRKALLTARAVCDDQHDDARQHQQAWVTEASIEVAFEVHPEVLEGHPKKGRMALLEFHSLPLELQLRGVDGGHARERSKVVQQEVDLFVSKVHERVIIVYRPLAVLESPPHSSKNRALEQGVISSMQVPSNGHESVKPNKCQSFHAARCTYVAKLLRCQAL